ncbi:MAG: ACT domain-containing protein [Pseudomonadota bacterium]
MVVSDTSAMISGMAPVLDRTVWHFCSGVDTDVAQMALATFREEEGLSCILSAEQAEGFSQDLPMARITLTVHSALDGVGLTAAVATALAQADIPCNMVAAFHHDHAFVPWAARDKAMSILQDLASRGAAS